MCTVLISGDVYTHKLAIGCIGTSVCVSLISGLMLLVRAWFAQPSWAAGWSQYGGKGGQQYTPLTQIDAENVKELGELWRFRTGDLGQGFRRKGHSMQVQPAAPGNNTLYVSTSANWVVAVDAVSGAEKWRFDAELSKDVAYSESGSEV